MVNEQQELYDLSFIAIVNAYRQCLGDVLRVMSQGERVKCIESNIAWSNEKRPSDADPKTNLICCEPWGWEIPLNGYGGTVNVLKNGNPFVYTHRYNYGSELTEQERLEADEKFVRYAKCNAKLKNPPTPPITDEERLEVIAEAEKQQKLPKHDPSNRQVTIFFMIEFSSIRVALDTGELQRYCKGVYHSQYWKDNTFPAPLLAGIDHQLRAIQGHWRDSMKFGNELISMTNKYPHLGFQKVTHFHFPKDVDTGLPN